MPKECRMTFQNAELDIWQGKNRIEKAHTDYVVSNFIILASRVVVRQQSGKAGELSAHALQLCGTAYGCYICYVSLVVRCFMSADLKFAGIHLLSPQQGFFSFQNQQLLKGGIAELRFGSQGRHSGHDLNKWLLKN